MQRVLPIKAIVICSSTQGVQLGQIMLYCAKHSSFV